MKKLSIVLQWIVLAALAAGLVHVIVRPAPRPLYEPAAWRDWSGVTVLSYAGVARRDSPDYPSVKRLEAHLTALAGAGYRTVRPEDVRAFLDERAPLPRKALLLIFEGGRKEAFVRATPILQRTGFSAVIAVPTALMRQWGAFYLKPADLRRVARLPQWQVGSMGHQAIENAGGAAAERFLARRLATNGRVESADAFRERILRDYALSAAALRQATGKAPLLYLYPFGEAGQSPGADPLAEAANRAGVTGNFQLAFIGGANAFNGPGSDPWALTRLRVPGHWTPARLLGELAASQPRSRPRDDLGTAREWTFEREGAWRDAALSLNDGALAWLRGTDAWTDLEASAALQPEGAGQAALYARYASVRSWLRVTVGGGELRVQERLEGSLHTLYRGPADGAARSARQVRLRLRNNRAWVWLDGQPAAQNLPLAPATRRGRVGLGSEGGTLSVSIFSARPLPARWLRANSIRLAATEASADLQAILPNWFRAGLTPAVPETARQDLLQAAVSGIHTIPLLTGGAALDAAAARAWAATLDEELIRADLKLLLPTLAVEGPVEALASELRNRHYRVAHLLTPAQALDSGRSIAQATADETILVDGVGPEASRAIAWLSRVVPSSRLVWREAEAAATASAMPAYRVYEEHMDR
jgi:peptidoglycan/xylan/chitin deacetylase (PgdA/CDA1 family)